MSSITLHGKKDFVKMHKAGRLAAEVLDYITDFIKPNVTTEYLDNLCHNYIISNKAIFSIFSCIKMINLPYKKISFFFKKINVLNI